jgi:hypothetical protein
MSCWLLLIICWDAILLVAMLKEGYAGIDSLVFHFIKWSVRVIANS